jgi:hypothetical protein
MARRWRWLIPSCATVEARHLPLLRFGFGLAEKRAFHSGAAGVLRGADRVKV